MKIQIPRRSRREAVQWHGRYQLAGDEDWTECRGVDLSMGGAAIEIEVPAQEPSGLLTLALDDVEGQPVGLELPAQVAYWNEHSTPGRLRVGVEFLEVTKLQKYRLAGLTSRERQRRQ